MHAISTSNLIPQTKLSRTPRFIKIILIRCHTTYYGRLCSRIQWDCSWFWAEPGRVMLLLQFFELSIDRTFSPSNEEEDHHSHERYCDEDSYGNSCFGAICHGLRRDRCVRWTQDWKGWCCCRANRTGVKGCGRSCCCRERE
jgi:hypothetical protein